MATLSPDAARRLRLASLLLADERARTPLEVAEWFGAMQGQDLGSLQWSFGVRMAGSTLADVDGAFERAEVLRTWPMRGTVHAIPAEDARWMLALGTPRALQGVERRWATLGIDRPVVEQGCEVLRELLAGGKRLARSSCVERLADAGLATAPGHGYHLLWYASQVGVTCMGPQEGKEATFALLDEWAPHQRELDRDESLAEIARRFVRSHGPAPRQDLAGWTGLTQGDAKAAIALAGDEVATVVVDGTEMAVSAAVADEASSLLAAHDPARVWALTGFDEYVLGYKDRSLIVDEAHKDDICPGGNGVFANTIVADGRAIGTWKRTVRAKRIDVAAQPFGRFTKAQRASFEQAMSTYAAFYDTEAVVTTPRTS